MIRLNRSKFGNWPSGPRSKLAHPTLFGPGWIGGGSKNTSYVIENSLRCRTANSAYLSRTFAAGNAQRFSMVRRMKRGQLGVSSGNYHHIFGAGPLSMDFVRFDTSDRLEIQLDNGSGAWLVSNRVFRDPTAWGTLLVAIDTTQATAANRIRVYWNDEEITSWSTNTQPVQNYNCLYFNSARVHELGRDPVNGNKWFDGCVTEDSFTNGTQLTPASLGEVDAASGAWRPIKYVPPISTNNYLLEYKDASAATAAAIGKDTSGNGNNWTPNGISVTSGVTFDQLIDTPTNASAAGTRPVGNYAVLNPLTMVSGSTAAGNMRYTNTSGGTSYGIVASLPITSDNDLVYVETTLLTSPTGQYPNIGLWHPTTRQLPVPAGQIAGQGAYSDFGQAANGFYYINNAGFSSFSYTTNDVVMLAFKRSTGEIWMGKNGTWHTGNPSTLTSPLATITANLDWWFSIASAFSAEVEVNFGQKAFVHTPPTNFRGLCTTNLSDPAIKRGDDAFYAGLRTGTGATANVTGLRFAPDLVWPKSRSAATNHNLFDRVRGAQNGLVSNGTAAEYADANSLTAFNADGFTFGSDAGSRGVNINTNTYVDWAWREGAAYGFDIVTATGTGANRTIAHSLNAVPHMMIGKRRDSAADFVVYHRSLATDNFLYLNLTNAAAANATFWNGAPTSSIFNVGTQAATNANGGTYVYYLWTSIPGFSLFGSYVGNGSADGPFVWCGFRPRWVLVKRYDTTGDWYIHDTARSPTNVMANLLYPNGAGAEFNTGTRLFDFTANGFKLRSSDPDVNASGGTFIFAAFAETPFKFANAR